MTLLTGTPEGTILQQQDVYIEGAPYIFYQDVRATPLFNPDDDGFYWGMSGTTTYPAVELACYQDVALSEDMTINAIRCDKTGDVGVIQKRNFLDLSLTLKTLLPLTTISPILKGGAVTTVAPFEKMGIGDVNNNIYYQMYLPKVYDPIEADYVTIQLHRAQFVGTFALAMPSGDAWSIGGISIRAFADTTKPTAQKFATIIRYDPSLIT